jgi:hypothetical protein
MGSRPIGGDGVMWGARGTPGARIKIAQALVAKRSLQLPAAVHFSLRAAGNTVCFAGRNGAALERALTRPTAVLTDTGRRRAALAATTLRH